MDEKIEKRIREFVRLVIDVHDEGYPSCKGELVALIDSAACEVRIGFEQAEEIVRDELGTC